MFFFSSSRQVLKKSVQEAVKLGKHNLMLSTFKLNSTDTKTLVMLASQYESSNENWSLFEGKRTNFLSLCEPHVILNGRSVSMWNDHRKEI